MACNSVALVMEFPFTKAFPSLGSNNPHNMEMAVVLPAPLGPCGKEEKAEGDKVSGLEEAAHCSESTGLVKN
jgi:hypothetical protein